MIFKDEKQLKNFLMEKCKVAVIRTQNKIYEIIKKALAEFYQDYDPVLYERTYQLMQSLVKSDIRRVGSGYQAEVYFDLSGINYATGNMPTGEQVMKAASHGLHGAIGSDLLYMHGDTGVDVWNTPMQEIDARAISMLVQELKAQGIPIKK